MEKVPCMLVVGDKEIEDSTVSVRLRTGEQLPPQSIDNVIESIKTAEADKSKDIK
jgi:threonyl-tRNA synthetase